MSEIQQGTDEWLEERSGLITASMFSTVVKKTGMLSAQQQKYVDAVLGGAERSVAAQLAGYKAPPSAEGVRRALAGEPVGDWSSAAMDYAFRLAVERISRKPLDEGGFETYYMRRGRELEHEARMEHEAQTGLIVERAGFITNDEGFGASADGFIGDDEGVEYKCFTDPSKIRGFWIDNDIDEVMFQVQGGMWVTGRKRWHVCLYCPALEPIGKQLWHRVFERDDEFIGKMVPVLRDFKTVVDDYEKKLRN